MEFLCLKKHIFGWHMLVTRVLGQRPNSRDSNMSGLATFPNIPIKEMGSDEGQRKDIY
jgi:hypothetical protein